MAKLSYHNRNSRWADCLLGCKAHNGLAGVMRIKEKYGTLIWACRIFGGEILKPYSLRAVKSYWISGALHPPCDVPQGSRSNFACLAEKQAFRLGCASLSAHPALRFKASPTKRKIRHTRMSMPYFWRRRKDLNLRAGYPTYTLSRGASSPLEYFSTGVVVNLP